MSKIVSSNTKSPMNAQKSRNEQKVSRINQTTNESYIFDDKGYAHQKDQLDSINATLMRTLDSSNAKDSIDMSLSTSQTTSKKKMISLLLERSRMSPTKEHEESSFMKPPTAEKTSVSNDQRRYSGNKENQAIGHITSNDSKKITYSTEAKRFEEPTLLKDKYPVNVQVSEFTIEDTKPSRIEEHEINLQVAVSGLNIKTFLTIRSILQPHPLIQDATRALLCLFSGLSDLIPPQIIYRERVDWKEIKNYLQSPTVLVNYVNCFKDICYQIDVASVARANRLITSTKPDENYSSDVYKALQNFVKAAIAYYLHTFPQYSLLNLHLFEPNLRDDDIGLEQPQKRVPTPTRQTPKMSKNSTPKASKSSTPKMSKTSTKVVQLPPDRSSKSPAGRSKTPTNAGSKKISNPGLEVQFKTPNASRPKTPSTKPEKEFLLKSGSKSPAAASRYKTIKPHYAGGSAMITPKAKSSKVFNLNTSVELKPKTGTDSKTRNKRDLLSKIERALDEKSHRSVSPTPKVKPELNIEDKILLEELTAQIELEADTQTHKKAAKQFKQKISKLLLDEDKRVKQEFKIEQAIKDEVNREFAKQERKRLDEFVSEKENLEKEYDLENYKDKQVSRLIKKQLQKDREDEYQYHELSQNLEKHFIKIVDNEKKKKDHHDFLKERLMKLRKDQQFKQQKELQQKDEEAHEFKNKRENDLIWKNAEALKDRVQAEQEYRLLDKLINGN